MLKETLNSIQTALKGLTDINSALDEALIVAITDQKGVITFANQKFCEISKYSKTELLGQNHRIINSGYHSKEFFRHMWKMIANGQIWHGEIQNKAKDGTLYWMDTTIVPCLNEQGKPYQYVSFRINITERKKAEEYLRRSDKIAAVGQMASGIAHEIRNPLAAIKWGIKLIQAESDSFHQQFDLILAEINRIDTIIGELLSLAKPQKSRVTYEYADIKNVLETIVAFMNIQAMRSNVKLLLHFDDNIPKVFCEENQLKQVFINLIKNAIEAMPKGGIVSIQVKIHDPNFIQIRFLDQGCGIPEEQIKMLGEPFFTTKEKGTGLGLMVCQKIIQEHQGKMSILSQVNEGTTVDVILPVDPETSYQNIPIA